MQFDDIKDEKDIIYNMFNLPRIHQAELNGFSGLPLGEFTKTCSNIKRSITNINEYKIRGNIKMRKNNFRKSLTLTKWRKKSKDRAFYVKVHILLLKYDKVLIKYNI